MIFLISIGEFQNIIWQRKLEGTSEQIANRVSSLKRRGPVNCGKLSSPTRKELKQRETVQEILQQWTRAQAVSRLKNLKLL